MMTLRAGQTLASRSRSLLLSTSRLHATAGGAGRWGATPRPALSSRGLLAGIAGAVSFSVMFVKLAGAEAKERVPVDLVPQNLVLYHFPAIPFYSEKVRAFLEYHAIPYKVVEFINPRDEKTNLWSAVVPILTVDGEDLANSSDIINILQSRVSPDDVRTNEEAKWCRWVDEHLVWMLLTNIYWTPSEALEYFDYIAKSGNLNFIDRFGVKYAAAAAMYMLSKKLKKEYNITDERASLYDAANTWTEALDGRDFLGNFFFSFPNGLAGFHYSER